MNFPKTCLSQLLCLLLECPNCLAVKALRFLLKRPMQLSLSRYKFKSLRHCLTGGEPLNPEVLEQWREQTGLELYEGYGQTEVVYLAGIYV